MDKSILPKHTCSSCGFLTVQVPSDESVVESTGLTYRETGRQTTETFTNGWPMCFVLAQRIDQEAEQLRAKDMSQTAENVKTVIQKPRPDCPEWMGWVPWLSPKEHREMMDRQWMLDREDKRDADAKKWQLKLAFISGLLLILAAMVGALYGAYVQQVVNPPNITIQMPAFTPTPIPTFTPTPTPAPAAPPPASQRGQDSNTL